MFDVKWVNLIVETRTSQEYSVSGEPKEGVYDIIKDIKCERCKNEKEQIKAGKTKAGRQKYKCKICGKVYTPKPKERNYSEEAKKKAIKLYME